ncbi:hypothetical protein H114_00782 [Streptomyces gancidicus BKS 13-15]|uniref:Uncharacterized protein n=1 Tax=Streptomyces gancidicus BKS 13-15 TaxID=1284664 RepID=M3C415_STREZ|nr:hypothetical protein [Streptomyces gancidicus]EMF31119.1 hypothetical protein H114_00782 [Streptomyces gancidicus BKS 13-15]
MRIIRLTPEQARTTGTLRLLRLTPEAQQALRDHMARAAEVWRQLVDAFRQMARAVTAAVRPLVEFLRRNGYTAPPSDRRRARPRTAVTWRADRPAWASPYGPAPRRHR